MSLQRRNRVRCWKPVQQTRTAAGAGGNPWQQAGTGAAKAKAQTAGSESAKERNELFADPEKEARISKVREGIRQTAAAESRFAGMLTPRKRS